MSLFSRFGFVNISIETNVTKAKTYKGVSKLFLTLFAIAVVMTSVGVAQMPPVADLLPFPGQLPLMTMIDGTQISTLNEWNTLRKPELQQAMQHYVYGYLPPAYPMTTTTLVSRNDAFNGLATYTEVQLDIALPSGNTMTAYVSTFVPNNGPAEKPVVLYLSGDPLHVMTSYDQVTVRTYDGLHSATRGGWEANYLGNAEYPLKRGYAIAHIRVADFDPDLCNDTGDGLYSLLGGTHAPGTTEHELRNYASWTWGAHRAVDYLETRSDIDQDKIVATGFSRFGQTAALATALDDRIDAFWGNSAGGQNYRTRGIPVDPGWHCRYADYYTNFELNEDVLPFDGTSITGLIAPRPFIVTSGQYLQGGAWQVYDGYNSPSTYGEMVAGDEIYALMGSDGVVGYASGSSIPPGYTGQAYQVIDQKKGHFMDVETMKHGFDFLDLKFNGSYSDPFTQHVYEAENRSSQSGTSNASTTPNYYGTGYVTSFDNSGDYIEFDNIAPGAGTHYIGIRAAADILNGSPLKSIDVTLNGVLLANDHQTGSWSPQFWIMDFRIQGDFNAGNNTIRITRQGSSTESFDLDRIVIYELASVPEPAADFDVDGDVDGADFLKWQRGELPNPLSSSELANWQASFGDVSRSVATTSATVPEPTIGILLMLGMATSLTGRRTLVSELIR